MRLLTILMLNLTTFSMAQDLKESFVSTSMGKIAVHQKRVEGSLPLIFLHGVYFDHHLWDYQVQGIGDRTLISIDMPLHGKSKDIRPKNWSLEDCAMLLLELMDSLSIPKAYAVGHSWGSMTILRAAHHSPERFAGLALCNMPLDAGSAGRRMQFRIQHLLLPFRSFYIQQVAHALYGPSSLALPTKADSLKAELFRSLGSMKARDIRQTDRAVIMKVKSGWLLVKELKVPVLALRGKEDYVPDPTPLEARQVEGGHVSPLEAPEQVLQMIQELW